MDDSKKTGRLDRAQVNINEEYEVEHLAQKFGVSPAKVRQAEQVMGRSRQKVEEYLMSRK